MNIKGKKYWKTVERLNIFENFDKLIPQTAIHDMILKHCTSENSQNKMMKKALLIVLDGCRSDVMPFILGQKYGIKRVIDAGGLYGMYGSNTYGAYHCETAPCFASMLTGIWANEGTGVERNTSMKEVKPLTVISKVAYLDTKPSVSVLATWSGHTDIQYKKEFDNLQSNVKSFDVKNTENDDVLTATAIEKAKSCDALFCFFDSTDGAGHSFGYGAHVPGYVADLLNANVKIDKILDSVMSRKNYENEDWLILVTTDHGGQDKTHWEHSPFERLIWVASNKKIDYSVYDNRKLKF